MSRLIIIGASGHGKVIADIAARCGYTDIAFLDDNPNIREIFSWLHLLQIRIHMKCFIWRISVLIRWICSMDM